MPVKKDEKEIKQPSIISHFLVPEHRVMTEEEKKGLLEKYDIKTINLPNISVKDPVAKTIKAKIGDVIEIKRKSSTAGESNYYRVVVSD
jgi:DNA-directed RNA polymerase subunit H